jgi:recombination protein RecT
MTIATDTSGKLQPTALTKAEPTSIKSILMGEGMRQALKMALPKHVTADRIARVALTAISRNPNLARCTQESFFGSLLSAAQLGLEVNTPLGLAYLIPYKADCQLIIGYQGMIELASRANVDVYGDVVREGDLFEYEQGLEQKLVHKPSADEDRDSKPVTHVYAIGTPQSGRPRFVVLSRVLVEKFRKRSRSASSGPWVTDWEAMAVKTAVRRLFRWLPKSIELQQAIVIDETHETGAQKEVYDASVIDALGSLRLTDGNATQDAEFVESEGNAQ